ncbi:MAG: PglZ domain-containing protein [Blastocatellia bacterium]|nr:PglZ domain-containing protein [Blastocatellia bacterium]
MGIADFITKTILQPRLKTKNHCLVVYDPERRFREVCERLATGKIRLVDASESSIESREAAHRAFREMGRSQTAVEGLVVYIPARKPTTDQEKQANPFAVYGECGGVFPEDDGDTYESLCLRAKPDFATDIRRIFAENPSPAFAVIDAIGGGVHWPQLRGTLRAESGRGILKALLNPTTDQKDALKASEGWNQEARQFLRTTLGLELKTKKKTWDGLAEEIWAFVLFSEFVFDLPTALPEALASVPRAPVEAKPLINDLCEGIRSDVRLRGDYIERAVKIETDYDLPKACSSIEDLGERDTFPFEERTFLRRALNALQQDDPELTRTVIKRHAHSVWVGRGENQEQWALVEAALNLIECCDEMEPRLESNGRSQTTFISFYVGHLREVDRLQREFEAVAGDFHDSDGLLTPAIHKARSRYSRLTEKVQNLFVKHLETEGWPPAARLSNTDVFDRFVGERLKVRGNKVGYLMVDALRYELGLALQKELSEKGPVEIHAACAQFPTITLIGMASLLPGARADLTLENEGEKLIPKLAGTPVATVAQRMEAIRKRFGDRFQEMTLKEFVKGTPKPAATVDLLVLRSTEIDSHLESNPESTLGLIPKTLNMIRAALHKLGKLGFTEAVIATDHGFFLNSHAEAGDVCAKPKGKWLVAHDRMMLGDGMSDSHSVVVSANKVGINGGFNQVAVPRSMAPYRAGHLYFHGGASLAEAIVPVLVARLEKPGAEKKDQIEVKLSYKNAATRITTRLPVIEVKLFSPDLFSLETSVEIMLEAHNQAGEVIGEPRPGGDVNPASRTITLAPNQSKSIVIKMDPEFQGKFTIKALNPSTNSTYCTLSLETDYTV